MTCDQEKFIYRESLKVIKSRARVNIEARNHLGESHSRHHLSSTDVIGQRQTHDENLLHNNEIVMDKKNETRISKRGNETGCRGETRPDLTDGPGLN